LSHARHHYGTVLVTPVLVTLRTAAATLAATPVASVASAAILVLVDMLVATPLVLVDMLVATLLVATLTLVVKSCLVHAITALLALLAWLAARKVCRRRYLNELCMFGPLVLL
jgi:hypothetical protein